MTLQNTGTQLVITGVFGPATRTPRPAFYEELKQHKPQGQPWLLCGDFNATLLPDERSTSNTNWREMADFANIISDLGIINTTLGGRRFTWSNARCDPSMARLDRFLFSPEWNGAFPNSDQTALPNTSSDHCPIMYTACTGFKKTTIFRFENSWLQSEEFRKMVREEWSTLPTAKAPAELQKKLTRLQGAITRWSKSRRNRITTQLQVCREFLGWIDRAEEIRMITVLEKKSQGLN